MCLDVPSRVLEVDEDGSFATVEAAGRTRRASLVVLAAEGRTVRPGDWLSMNSGIAVRVLGEAEALETLHWFEEARRDE